MSNSGLYWSYSIEPGHWLLTLDLLEHFHLIIGLEEHLFTYPYRHVSQYCDPTWSTSLWQFVDSILGTVHLDQRWHLHVQCQFDSFIMEEFLLLASRLQNTRKKLTAKGLRQLNACRLFLQVLPLGIFPFHQIPRARLLSQ
jgi:hypothetical protein